MAEEFHVEPISAAEDTFELEMRPLGRRLLTHKSDALGRGVSGGSMETLLMSEIVFDSFDKAARAAQRRLTEVSPVEWRELPAQLRDYLQSEVDETLKHFDGYFPNSGAHGRLEEHAGQVRTELQAKLQDTIGRVTRNAVLDLRARR